MTDRCVVLLGIGHTHAHVLRKWGTAPLNKCRLVCISRFPFATYSGMLPGAVAGQFSPGEMQIELATLTARAGAELLLAEVTGLDAARRTLYFADADPLPFDVLSIGVGSMPLGWDRFDADALVPIKPMQTFLERLDARLRAVSAAHDGATSVIVVGGGVAGVEIALCLQRRLENQFSGHTARIAIVTGSDEIGDGLHPRSVSRLHRILDSRAITVHTSERVVDIRTDAVVTSQGTRYSADCVVWATGAAAPPVLSKLGLPTDKRGFLATRRNLQTTADLPIFAVGDAGTILDDPSPKAGVYAVRQGPILWRNMRSVLNREPLREFRPQKDFLKIINTGEGRGLLEYHRHTYHAAWCWWLKRWIDKRFVQQYQVSAANRE